MVGPSSCHPGTPVPLTVKKPNLPPDQPAAVPTTGNITFTDTFDSDTAGGFQGVTLAMFAHN